jgi:hypothetical protein
MTRALVRAFRQMRRGVAVTPAPGEHMSLPQKASLVVEVLIAYARARRYMARGDIRVTVKSIHRRWSPTPAPAPAGSADEWRVSFQLARAATRTLGMLPCNSRCLDQSLVVCQLLSARSIPCTLVIGARTNPEFAAHAWVEHAGRPVLPPGDFAESRLIEI